MKLSFVINREQHLLRQYRTLELIDQGPQLPRFAEHNNESAVSGAKPEGDSVCDLRLYIRRHFAT